MFGTPIPITLVEFEFVLIPTTITNTLIYNSCGIGCKFVVWFSEIGNHHDVFSNSPR
jgi:hypothetical protein